ncbi:synaptotagmin-5-like isoform X2 [Lotus japonicus]|uniref:synaptotagmin-5-like isoform X2 n=1 Tax=Lotus japonicus TaxID=34305 RepID=UPI00258892A2|nr:synaptotagmin-5-like isoform X2 [Lotus japonicus]
MAIDQKESLHLNRKTLSLLSKFCSGKAKENATASSSHSMSTPVLEVVNESEQEEQPELLLSAPNDSMTSLEKSSTNGIDANAATHKIKEVIVRGNLTVTVISAENLPALDFMRKSDPYVVLTLRKAKSKVETICQTKVVNNCLNPSWNQAFDFVVEDGLHDELIVEVWDHDTIGKDDFMGRCTLSLKRVIHEEEYEGRFKLVCAERFGAESSYLKLHLKWMHQPTHSDSNFLPSFSNDLELKPVGILKVKLMQAKELTNGHTFRKPDLFVVLHMQASGETGKESETIVHVELLYCPYGMKNSFTNPLAPNCSMASLEEVCEGSANGIEANGNENAVTEREKEVIIRGILSVTVISAEDLPGLDFMGKSDPFVVLTLRKAKSKEEIRHKTKVVNQSLNPVWIETFPFNVEDGLHDMVIVEVWDKDTFGKDYIGRCILSLTKVILEGEYTDSFDLVGAKSGSLELHLKRRF